ncbi:Endo-1,3(4)-beta-glucanase [Phytophthora cactorum]|nr:Endo-1,3(4)-beta-glucanase [Phytophthora cactorum]
MGVAVQTCMSGIITSCMESALVHGMVFMSATSTGLTTSIQLDYATTLPDGSTPGKVVVQFANGLTADSHSENSDQGVYDYYASYVVRGGDMLVQSRTRYSPEWKTEGSGCDNSGLLHFILPEVYVMGGASTTQSRGAIVLHSSARGDMVGQVTTTVALEHLTEPFISNSLSEPLIYEKTYKGIVTSQVFTTDDVKVEFGNGVYNDHHYHYGYWITALIILKKLGQFGRAWLRLRRWW